MAGAPLMVIVTRLVLMRGPGGRAAAGGARGVDDEGIRGGIQAELPRLAGQALCGQIDGCVLQPAALLVLRQQAVSGILA